MNDTYTFLDQDQDSETFGKWCARIGSISIDGFDTQAEAEEELQAMLEDAAE